MKRWSPILALVLGGCGTPIGDTWHLGSMLGVLIVAIVAIVFVYRYYYGGDARRARRQARRDERREDRPQPK